MTQDFLDGVLVTLLPSMLVVAWLVWRAPAVDDSDFSHEDF
jgi:hypothetical protein